ncbi:MAG: hypothetical protein V3U75_04685, partial [Methylococcaceae bacterium]
LRIRGIAEQNGRQKSNSTPYSWECDLLSIETPWAPIVLQVAHWSNFKCDLKQKSWNRNFHIEA